MNSSLKVLLTAVAFIIFCVGIFEMFNPLFSPTGCFGCVSGLNIINPYNKVSINSELKIDFTVSGNSDLNIIARKGDIELKELRCNGNLVIPVIQGKNAFYKSFSCNGQAYLIVKILSKETDIEMAFGNSIKQIKNIAS